MIEHFLLRAEDADAVELIRTTRGHHLDLLALLHHAVFDAHENHNAQVRVVPAVDQHGFQRLFRITLGWRQKRDDAFENGFDIQARLRRHADCMRSIDADDVFDLLFDAIGVG